MGFAGLVADELAVGARHAVDPDARGAEVWHERPLVGGVDADLVRVAGLLAVGEGGVQLDLEQAWRAAVIARDCADGSVDLIARKGDLVIFVEVKARAPSDPTLEDAVTPGKQRKLTRAATAWMLENGTADECAFMVALVRFHDEGWSIDWIDDAFDAG